MNRARSITAGLILALAITMGCARERSPEPAQITAAQLKASTAPKPGVDFAATIQPMLVARCSPCHFPGGKMYEKLPFDRAVTVRQLGSRMFTRIKNEPDVGTLRAFLDEPDAK